MCAVKINYIWSINGWNIFDALNASQLLGSSVPLSFKNVFLLKYNRMLTFCMSAGHIMWIWGRGNLKWLGSTWQALVNLTRNDPFVYAEVLFIQCLWSNRKADWVHRIQSDVEYSWDGFPMKKLSAFITLLLMSTTHWTFASSASVACR